MAEELSQERLSDVPCDAREEAEIAAWTDHYFLRTKTAVERFGDIEATYAVFMRRPVISAPWLATSWLEDMARRRGTAFDIELRYEEGKWVGAGEPIMYISGPLTHLVDLETILLQKLGPPCVAAYNASARLPRDGCAPLRRARHGPGHGLCGEGGQRSGEA